MPRFQNRAGRLFGAQQMRQQLSKDPNVGEALRDTQGALDQIPIQLLRTITGLYAEPLALGSLPSKPLSVEAISVVDQADQETPVLTGSLCHCVWDPQKGGAQIKSIDGLSANGKTYRFTFRITFAQGGGV